MKISISTVGSKFSQAANDACREIVCDAEKTSFKIISVVEFPQMITADPFAGASADFFDRFETQGHSLAKTFLDESAERLHGLFPKCTLDVVTEILDGTPARVIVEEAENWSAELIVVGEHGYGFWNRACSVRFLARFCITRRVRFWSCEQSKIRKLFELEIQQQF